MNSYIKINNLEMIGLKISLVMMILKISNIKSLKNRKKISIKKQDMPIIQLSNLNKIYNKCMKKDKEENNKKCNMQNKFKDKRNNEDNKEILMFRIN